MTKERICALEKLDYKWLVEQSHVPAILSLLVQKENGGSGVLAVAPDDDNEEDDCGDRRDLGDEFYESDGDCWVI